MPVTRNQPQHPDTPKARQIGMWVFVAAAALQMLISGLAVGSLVAYRYFTLRESEMRDAGTGRAEDQPGADILRGNFSETFLDRFLEIVPALVISALAYILLMGWRGRWAGMRVGIHKTRFGWVGVAGPVFPSVLSAMILVATFFATNDDRIYRGLSFDNDIVYPFLLFTGCFFVPGIVFGIFAALISRQRFRGWQQLQGLGEDEWTA